MLTVGIIGTRGIPNRYGGFERFVELLVCDTCWEAAGIRFIVFGESADEQFNAWTDLRKVSVAKDKQPLRYYIESVRQASGDCDVVFCCGVGLSFFSLWPMLRGKALVVNPDGCEWRRTKWSWLGRQAIHAMYLPALAVADRVVIDAEALREDFGSILRRKAVYIGYQAPEPRLTELSQGTCERFALHSPYVLVIARLEPENNIETIVRAFSRCATQGVELVIVGGTGTRYYQTTLAELATPQVRFVGAIFEQSVLDELRSNCLAYLHGHSVGGTNPSLIEALATVGGRLICHDNKYNREVAGDEASYFLDGPHLESLLTETQQDVSGVSRFRRQPSRDPRFDGEVVARKYLSVFQEAYASR